MIQLRNPHMTVASPENLKLRKTPRQTRAEATVDAILEATIQVLLSEGAGRLTTTRVAARAGVSVGKMYQYFAQGGAAVRCSKAAPGHHCRHDRSGLRAPSGPSDCDHR
jgi:hypothetical protein